FYYSCPLPLLHSFPTRRSSDLGPDAAVVLLHPPPEFLQAHLSLSGLSGVVAQVELFGVGAGAQVAKKLPALGVVGGHVVNLSGADRKSTRLNSSHLVISYAVFC